MNEYELMYVISPRLMVEEIDSTIERIQGLIEDAGGEILLTDNWGRRRLAYPIKHHFEGTYVLTHMTLPPDRVAGFERAMHLNEQILRHLVVRGIVPGYDGPPEEELVYARRGTSRPAPGRSPAADGPVAAEATEAADAPEAAEAADEPATTNAPEATEVVAEAPEAAEAAEASEPAEVEAPAEAAEPADAAETPEAAEGPDPEGDAETPEAAEAPAAASAE